MGKWPPSRVRSEQYRPAAVALRERQPDTYLSLLDTAGKVLRNMDVTDVQEALSSDPDLAVAFVLALSEAKRSKPT